MIMHSCQCQPPLLYPDSQLAPDFTLTHLSHHVSACCKSRPSCLQSRPPLCIQSGYFKGLCDGGDPYTGPCVCEGD